MLLCYVEKNDFLYLSFSCIQKNCLKLTVTRNNQTRQLNFQTDENGFVYINRGYEHISISQTNTDRSRPLSTPSSNYWWPQL